MVAQRLAVWAMALLLAAGWWMGGSPAAAAAIRQQVGDLVVKLTGAPGKDGQAVYQLLISDGSGRPVTGAAASLEAQLPGAVYATSSAGLSGMTGAAFVPASDPGLYRATVQYPARGIWEVRIRLAANGIKSEVPFTENVGEVWSDRDRGLAMLGAVTLGAALWAGWTTRSRRVRRESAAG